MSSKIALSMLIVLGFNIVGCALSKEQYADKDYNFGAAVRSTVQSQIANPNTVNLPSTSYQNGMEGYSANQVLNGYRNSFTKPSGTTESSATSNNMNNLSGVGSSTTGQ